MDPTAAFRNEVFRPLVTLVVPGATALAPYVILLRVRQFEVRQFWNDHTTSAFLVTALAAITVGLILEGVGARIETAWDARLDKQVKGHTDTWYKYLRLTLVSEPIGQRYLRTITLALKFELAMAAALPLMYVGLLWLDRSIDLFGWKGAFIIGMLVAVLTAYLLYESWSSSKVLSRVRQELVEQFYKPAA